MMIKDYANLAFEILENNTLYKENKNLIYSFFKEKDTKLSYEKVKTRLLLIDELYSTNMNKRFFGIEDLAKEIIKISDSNDKNLILKINSFLDNLDNTEIKNFFDKEYGITKKGKGKKATSLISKYLYFLMDYQFPIYDSLVRKYLPEINEKSIKIELNFDTPNNFFKKIKEFNQKSDINDFNKLDNLCWLFGKIKECNFSLIFNKEKYLKLIKNQNLCEFIKTNPSPLTKNEQKFIEWVFKD